MKKGWKWLLVLLLPLGWLVLAGAGSVPEDEPGIGIVEAGTVLEEDTFFRGVYFEHNGMTNGSLVVVAEKAIINGTVNGNLVFLGQELVLNATVSGDVFLGAVDAAVTGRTYGSVFAAADDLELQGSSETLRGLYAAGNRLSLYGAVNRDARMAARTLLVKGLIAGDLYYSAQNAQVASGSVKGSVHVDEIPKEAESVVQDITASLYSILSFLFSCLLIWFLLTFFFKDTGNRIRGAFPGQSLKILLYYGLFGIFASFLLGILLLLSAIGIPFGLILIFLTLSGMYLGSGISVAALGGWLVRRFPRLGGAGGIFAVLLVAVAASLLRMIPYAGVVLHGILGAYGYGLILWSFQGKKKEEDSQEHALIL